MRHLTLPQISASLDGELAGPSLELVQRHLAECELCRSDLARMAELDTLLVSAATYEPGEAFFDDLAARIEEGIGGRKRTPSRSRPEPLSREFPVRLYPPADAFGPGARIGSPEQAPARDVVPARDVPEAPSSAPLEIERGEVVSAIESAMNSSDDARAAEQAPPAFDERAFAEPEPKPKPAMPSAPLGDVAREAEFVDGVLEPERRYESTPRSRRREAHERRMAEERRRARRLKPRSGAALFVLGIAASALAYVIVMTMKNGPMLSGVVGRVMSPAESSSAPTRVDPPDPAVTVEPVPDLAAEMESAAEPPPALALAPEPEPEPARPVARSESPAPPRVPTTRPETVTRPRPKPVPPVEAAPVAALPRATSAPPGPVTPRETAPHETSSAPHETPRVAENPAPPSPPPAITMPPVTTTTTTVTSPSVAVAGGTGAVGLLCGDVRDKDGRPVARAQVRLDIGVAVLTDRAGHFCMTAPRGGRGVTVTAAGFAPGKTTVTVNESTPQLAVTLEPLAPATAP